MNGYPYWPVLLTVSGPQDVWEDAGFSQAGNIDNHKHRY